MRYDCSKNGCYNKTLRPKIETFAECFPRKIGMSDVDAIGGDRRQVFDD
jgi:hypothetical protein